MPEPRNTFGPFRLACGFLLAVAAWAGTGTVPARLIAVLPPELSSTDPDAGGLAARAVQDGLVALLSRDGRYQVVERADPKVLASLVAELAFQNGGLVADREAGRLGELAGIEVFVWVDGDLGGGFLGSHLRLRVRFIEVQTAKLLALLEVTSRGRPALDPERSVRDAVARGLRLLAARLPAP